MGTGGGGDITKPHNIPFYLYPWRAVLVYEDDVPSDKQAEQKERNYSLT
jgi:hypothetical protein